MLFGIEQPDPADSLLESLPVEGHVAEFGAVVGAQFRKRAIRPLSVMPRRIAARMRSSVVRERGERGSIRASGSSSASTCSMKRGKISRNEASKRR